MAVDQKEEDNLFLPPGFRFHPTDEELITHYLSEMAADQSFTAIAMGPVDLNKCEPWDLPSKAKMEGNEWYFFSQKERRYPTGMRTNRATESGYWKATGKDKEIYNGKGVIVGMKKTLVFYKGRAPKGEKTNWVMHEFRLEGNYPHHYKDDWVVVKVFHKNEGIKKDPLADEQLPAMEEAVPFQNPNYFVRAGPSDFGYLQYHDDEAMMRALAANATAFSSSPFIGQAKMEQFSGSVGTTSRDTGPSADWNAEISSYDAGGPSSSAPPLFDLEDIWNY